MTATPSVRTIGAHTYEVMPLASESAIRVMLKLGSIVSPALRSVAHLADAAKAVGVALAVGFDALDADSLVYVSREFAKVTHVIDGDTKRPLAPIFDEHFRGKFWDMPQWVRFAAEVTFGPLDEVAARMMPADSTKPPPSAPAAG